MNSSSRDHATTDVAQDASGAAHGYVDLSKARTGDEIVLSVKVREIDSQGRIWCDNPFQEVKGRYAAFASPPQLIELRRPGGQSSEGKAA